MSSSEKSVPNQEFQSQDKRDSLQVRSYEITRRAPPPPQISTDSLPEIKHMSEMSSDFVYVRYSNIDNIAHVHGENFYSGNVYECLISITNRLIDKEQLHILTLTTLMKDLEKVSTATCNTLPLLEEIVNFHKKILITDFVKCSRSFDVPLLFKKCEDKLRLYVTFTYARKDFSYLVTDLNEAVVNQFKARLLEYNFTISQIKNIYNRNVETRLKCNEAEDVIRKVYHDIYLARKKTMEEQEL